MVAKAEVKGCWVHCSVKRDEWLRSSALFVATLIATLVVGYPTDVGGLVTWFLTQSPLTAVHLSQGLLNVGNFRGR
jgi:hypothetical protein